MSIDRQLSVIWPDEERPGQRTSAAGLSAEMTLCDFFGRYAWPDCLAPKGDALSTRKDYEQSLAYWRLFTGDPPLCEISKRTCSTFVQLLAGSRGKRDDRLLAANTIYKHWINCERLLRWTGPQTRQNREGAGLIEAPPWISTPRKDRPGPRPAFSLPEIQAWLEALPRAARLPARMVGVDPAAWWRAVILLDYNTGLRSGTLFKIRWEQIAGAWLDVPAAISKGKQGRLTWLNRPALDAIEPLRAPGGLVFRWSNWPACDNTFGQIMHRQQRAAGVRPLTLYALRRAFCRELVRINPLAAQLAMGHSGLGFSMMTNHYLDVEALLAESLARLPQPGAAVQGELF